MWVSTYMRPMDGAKKAGNPLARAKARIRSEGGNRHSTLWWWVFDHFPDVDESLARGEVTYALLAEELEAEGLRTRAGTVANRHQVRVTVASVRREIERAKSKLGARRAPQPEPARPGPVPGVRILPQASPESKSPTPGPVEETDAIARVRERMAGARPWVSGGQRGRGG